MLRPTLEIGLSKRKKDMRKGTGEANGKRAIAQRNPLSERKSALVSEQIAGKVDQTEIGTIGQNMKRGTQVEGRNTGIIDIVP